MKNDLEIFVTEKIEVLEGKIRKIINFIIIETKNFFVTMSEFILESLRGFSVSINSPPDYIKSFPFISPTFTHQIIL